LSKLQQVKPGAFFGTQCREKNVVSC